VELAGGLVGGSHTDGTEGVSVLVGVDSFFPLFWRGCIQIPEFEIFGVGRSKGDLQFWRRFWSIFFVSGRRTSPPTPRSGIHPLTIDVDLALLYIGSWMDTYTPAILGVTKTGVLVVFNLYPGMALWFLGRKTSSAGQE